MAGETLSSYLKRKKKIQEKRALKWIMQIALAIEHIHCQNYVHRKVNLDNIIIDENRNIKLGHIDVISNGELDSLSNLNHMAPELFNLLGKDDGYFSAQVDVWSLGMTLVEMVTGTVHKVNH